MRHFHPHHDQSTQRAPFGSSSEHGRQAHQAGGSLEGFGSGMISPSRALLSPPTVGWALGLSAAEASSRGRGFFFITLAIDGCDFASSYMTSRSSLISQERPTVQLGGEPKKLIEAKSEHIDSI